MAISRSNLYATCSAFSLRRRSRRSSRVSIRVGGGVSFGSYGIDEMSINVVYLTEQTHDEINCLPRMRPKNFQHPNNLSSFFHVAIYLVVAEMAMDRVVRTMPANSVANTASFFHFFPFTCKPFSFSIDFRRLFVQK